VATFSYARPVPTVLVFMLVSIVATVLYWQVRKKQLAAAPGAREVDKQP
jgi:hypothetical protein